MPPGSENQEGSYDEEQQKTIPLEFDPVPVAMEFEMSRKDTESDSGSPVNTATIHGSAAPDIQTANNKVQLERKMGLISCVGMIVGTMIGSGIFVSPKDVLARSGSVGVSLIVWLSCGFLSLFGGLCYIELGCVVPKSGGEYTYFLEAYGPLHRFFGPLPAYLYSYSRVLATGPSAFAVISLSFATYATQPFYPDGELPWWLPKVVAICCVVAISAINSISVRLSTFIQNTFTAVKVVALAIIIVAGMVKLQLAEGNTSSLENGFTPFGEVGTTAAGVASAFYSGLWSYDGWNQLNLSMEEVINPFVNLPRAIWIAIPLVTSLYLVTNVAYLAVMTPLELLASNAVAVTFGGRVLGVMAWIIPFSVACSTFGAANGSNFGNARVCYVSARGGHMMKVLSYISISRLTPLPAVILQGSIAIFMITVGGITSLIDFFSFISWLFYALAFFSILVFRKTRKEGHHPYKVPLVIVIFMLVMAVALLILPLALSPQWAYLYATLSIFTGIIFYIPFIYFQKPVPGLDAVTRLLTRCCRIAPSKVG